MENGKYMYLTVRITRDLNSLIERYQKHLATEWMANYGTEPKKADAIKSLLMSGLKSSGIKLNDYLEGFNGITQENKGG